MLRKVLIDWILMPACLIFTVITLALTGIATTITNFAPQFEALIALFIYSVVLAALNRILYLRSLHIGLRLVLHCTGIVASFLAIFLLVLSDSSHTRGALIISAVIAVLYFIIAAIVLAVKHALKRNENEKKEYKKMFN